jgi:hypothetical protein
VILLIDGGAYETKPLTLTRRVLCKRDSVTGRISRARKCFFLGIENNEYRNKERNARFNG